MAELEFLEQMALVLAPTILGVTTSYLIVNSWQKRKEKSELVLKVLDKFDEYVMQLFTRMDMMFAELAYFPIKLEFVELRKESEIGEGGVLGKLEKQLDELKLLIDAQEYWKFDSLLQVYYKDETYSKKYVSIRSGLFLLSGLLKLWLDSTKNIFTLYENKIPIGYDEKDMASLGKEEMENLLQKSFDYSDKEFREKKNETRKKIIVLRNNLLEIELNT